MPENKKKGFQEVGRKVAVKITELGNPHRAHTQHGAQTTVPLLHTDRPIAARLVMLAGRISALIGCGTVVCLVARGCRVACPMRIEVWHERKALYVYQGQGKKRGTWTLSS